MVERNPSRPGPGEKARTGIGQHALVNALRGIAELLAIDDRQVHAPARQRVVAAEEIGADEGGVHHPPGKYARVEFGRRQRPGPRAHDHERAHPFTIGEGKSETGRAAPVVTNHGRVLNVQLSQQAGQVCDVAVERVCLFADGFLRQAKSDHVGNDDAPPRSHERLDECPVQETPGGIAVQKHDRIARSFIDIMHAPAIYPHESRPVGPLLVHEARRQFLRRSLFCFHRCPSCPASAGCCR